MPIDLDTIGYFLFMEEQEKKDACARGRSADETQSEEEQDE